MQMNYLLALATLGFTNALPQEAGGAPPATGAGEAPPSGTAPMASGGQMSMGGEMMGGQMGGQMQSAAPGQQGGVPSDLAGGFKPQMITMQGSYQGDAAQQPIMSGQKVDQMQAMQEPKFALGQGSQPKPGAMWVIMMVDAGDQKNRMLHMVKADYKVTGQQMQIQSSSQPKMQYTPPGGLGEQGQGKQYTFLMYGQNQTFPGKNMPQPGQPVVMKDFVAANGLDKAVAGFNMQMDVQPMQGGQMGGQQQMQSGAGGMSMSAGGAPMSMGAGGQMGGQMGGGQMSGGQMSGGAMPTGMGGMMGGGMMNGSMGGGMMSMPGGQPTQAPGASGASASPSAATGAANANGVNAAVGLGAVGIAAAALF